MATDRPRRKAPKPFDTATRDLFALDLESWMKYLGVQAAGAFELGDTNVSTVVAEVDKVIRVSGPPPWLVHVELQTRRDRLLEIRLAHYNLLLHQRHRLPVHTIVVLLRRRSDMPNLTGQYQIRLSGEDGAYLEFRYNVIRVWEQQVETVLAGGLGTLPMAPLANAADADIADVMRRMDERIEREATPAEARRLRAATLLLLGLRYQEDQVVRLLGEVHGMRDSATYPLYKALLAEGRVDGVRAALLRLGEHRFGPPSESTIGALRQVQDHDRLERMAIRLLDARSWDEVLAVR